MSSGPGADDGADTCGVHPPPSARSPGLCFPLATFLWATWVGTHGEVGLGTAGRAGVRAPGVSLTLRSGPPVLFGAWGTWEGGRACGDPMRAQGVKASVTGQRAHARRQSPGGWWGGLADVAATGLSPRWLPGVWVSPRWLWNRLRFRPGGEGQRRGRLFPAW